jgi:ornithine cyclodeaminase/alanine dehydrogenase-like protein (mu-crystallin family)
MPATGMAILIHGRELDELLSYEEAIEAVEVGFRRFAAGTFAMPQRLIFLKDDALMAAMPVADEAVMGIKVATVHPKNKHLGQPTVRATVLLLRAQDGELLSIVDGTSLTTIRTAAVSAVASKYLANPGPAELGVLGSGPLAIAHIRALAVVCTLLRVRVYSPRAQERWTSIERSLSDLELDVELAKDARDAVRKSTLLVLATSSHVPVLEWTWVNPGTHINAVGSHTPKARELDTETVLHSRVVCDSSEACWIEAGDLLIPFNEGLINRTHAEISLGGVLLGDEIGRQSAEQVTVFKSVGLAFEDLCTASAAWRNAIRTGAGVTWEPSGVTWEPY